MRALIPAIGVLIILGACTEDPAEPQPELTSRPGRAAELDPAGLVAGLPWTFEVTETETTDPDAVSVREVLLVSREGRSQSEKPPVHLRARFTSALYSDADAAAEAFEAIAAAADPDTGLSYSWDLVILHGSRLDQLHGDCTLSPDVFEAMVENLRRLLDEVGAQPREMLSCRCGGGCVAS